MATFHLSMKIGYSGSTIPHLQYITRAGKYEEKGEDLLYQKTINLPDWASSEMDFWKTVDTYDYRSYRKVTFALPNEVSKDEQIELAEKYLKKLLPDKTYTFVIHEVDSAIHGEKNPHVHVIFSERIIDERTKGMTKEMFFSKFGKSKNGREYGGSTKDRSWAGKKNIKLKEVRKELEDQINSCYKKNGLDLKVSCSTLEEQKDFFLFLGDIEKAELYNREKPVRLDEKIFNTYRDEIKNMIFANFSLDDLTNETMITRVLQEREKLLKDDLHDIQFLSNSNLLPTIDEQYLALQNSLKVCDKLLSEQPQTKKEEMISKLMLKAKELGLSSHNSAGVRLYPVLKTEDLIIERIITTLQNTEKTIARHEIEIEKLTLEKSELLKQIEKGFYSQTLDKLTDGKNKELYDKIRSQVSLRDFNQRIGNLQKVEELEAEIARLKKEHSSLLDHKISPTLLKATQDQFKEEGKIKLSTINNDLNLYHKSLLYLTEGKGAVFDTSLVEKYRKDFLKDIPKSIKAKKELLNKAIKEKFDAFSKMQSYLYPKKNLQHFINEEINKNTNGEIKALQEKNRSQKSLLDYNKKLGNDTISYQVSIKDIEKQIADLQIQFANKTLLKEAEEKLNSYLKEHSELPKKQASTLADLVKDSKRKNIDPKLAERIKKKIESIKNARTKGAAKDRFKKPHTIAINNIASKIEKGIKSALDTGRDSGSATIRTNNTDLEL